MLLRGDTAYARALDVYCMESSKLMNELGGMIFLMVLTLTSLVSASLLFWTWITTHREPFLLRSAIAYGFAALSALMLGLRGVFPDLASIVIGNAAGMLNTSLIYAGICAFNGRRPNPAWIFGPLLLWCLACLTPPIYGNPALRFSIATTFFALGYAVAGVELLRNCDGLRSRVPLAVGLFFQTTVCILRIPFVFVATDELFRFQGAIFVAMTVEIILFAQLLAYFVIGLVKERAEVALQQAALSDSLTGLPNRRAFLETAGKLMSIGRRHQRAMSLVIFDLDRFKQINDGFGHAAGDEALMYFAAILRRCLREGDLVARMGGEEFIALLPETGEQDARQIAQRVVSELGSKPLELAGIRHICTVSAGTACSQDGSQDLDVLMAAADRALYAAKQGGRNRVEVVSAASQRLAMAV